eukprot:CAMPEP_0114995004 /NCGR_PEP_ID=MMETSP0216-20121206/13473_1 /TAXON_ID=223996 /ORGANISM="Protocruzia adherens, Strain Boccale" /LENGTH=951 /DNA_ID=CAMNT_0002358967 /DNA_START=34 /DNA_END=2889 /DNA_ORIENTATION=-
MSDKVTTENQHNQVAESKNEFSSTNGSVSSRALPALKGQEFGRNGKTTAKVGFEDKLEYTHESNDNGRRSSGSTTTAAAVGTAATVAADRRKSKDARRSSKIEHKDIPVWKQRVQHILENTAFSAWMTILTVYALFGDDLRLLATEKAADDIFYSISCVCLFFFTLEIVLGCLGKDNYPLSFFFWLDVVATISLIPDIGWIWNEIVNTEDSSSAGSDNAEQATQLARAGRASRAGTRAGRIIRIVRMIRLIRIVKLYKHAQDYMDESHHKQEQEKEENGAMSRDSQGDSEEGAITPNQNRASMDSVETEERAISSRGFETGGAAVPRQPQRPEDLPEESRVGKKLSELTTKRVIILVLAMMFGSPIFQLDTYDDANNSHAYGLEVMKNYILNDNVGTMKIVYDHYVESHRDLDIPLISLTVFNPINTVNIGDFSLQYENPDDLRTEEKDTVWVTYTNDQAEELILIEAIFDLRFTTRWTAGLSMIRTVFVCIVLASAALFFSKDAQDLVLTPIETMIKKVNDIARNPLLAAQEEENQQVALAESELADEGDKKVKGKKVKEQPMETQILEQTIIKIGALLALGFGEAGSEIIAQNMAHGGDVNPMIPGKKVVAIFGFCDIRQFTDATEVLQEDVMLFVNEIAEIVHGMVDHFSGAANKNIGDAFLLVWKFNDEEDVVREADDTLYLRDTNSVHQTADMALMSFLMIVAKINTSQKLTKYSNHPGLNARIENYSVKMGFGLHVGWAIEGAIGSDFKIDASYLSPNVNMASRLEAATKQYGVPLLVSGPLFDIFSPETQDYLRLIDRATVKGAKEPIEFYTCDIDPSPLQVDTSDEANENIDKKVLKVRARMRRDNLRRQAMSEKLYIHTLFETEQELIAMRANISQEFLDEFKKATDLFIEGDWTEAKASFTRATEIKGTEDGPTQTLWNYMEEYNFQAPDDWKKYRVLTEK